MGIRCSQCGASNPDASVFCMKCGSRLNHRYRVIRKVSHSGEDSVKRLPINMDKPELAQSKKQMFPKSGVVLHSPEPFPDEVKKFKVVNWLAIAVGLMIGFSSQGSFFQKVMSGLLFGLLFMVLTHFLIVNGAASMRITKLNFQKYWLPYAISDAELAEKIAPVLHNLQLHTEANTGFTKGINIIYDNLLYKVELDNKKGCFTVSYHYRSFVSTYQCLIRDIPKIVYTIQRVMLTNIEMGESYDV